MWGFPKECPYNIQDCSIGLIGSTVLGKSVHKGYTGLCEGCRGAFLRLCVDVS